MSSPCHSGTRCFHGSNVSLTPNTIWAMRPGQRSCGPRRVEMQAMQTKGDTRTHPTSNGEDPPLIVSGKGVSKSMWTLPVKSRRMKFLA